MRVQVPHSNAGVWLLLACILFVCFPPQAFSQSNSSDFYDFSACRELHKHDGTVVFEMGVPQFADTLAAPTASLDVGFNVQHTLATPVYHSRPGTSTRIFLDFDGHVTSGTVWASRQTFTSPAYDIDGDASSFTQEELDRIEQIWKRVAEDFAPFDVDVTTEDPGAEALRWDGVGDTAWGIRIVIGGSGSDWYGLNVGGIAQRGSFGWTSDTPAYVFSNSLGNGSAKNVAEACSHEAGHTVGLGHDGIGGSSYYAGHGSGETGWAPIMGVAYGKNHSTFDNGSYVGASNTEDDLHVITSLNGFGYLADDHGNDNSSSTAFTRQGDALSASGLIESLADTDVFSFSTSGGQANIIVDVAEVGPNLDVSIELRDISGAVLATSNPIDVLGAELTHNLPQGTYYLAVESAGGYGHIGTYHISGTAAAGGPPEQTPPARPFNVKRRLR